MSMITVLCSTYNSSKWIEGYLEMINNQFLEKFDIIFVDANSTDGSLDTIKNFKFRQGIQPEIIKCNSRVPIYSAWNIAIERSRTPYVINVNTDDRLFPSGLQTMQEYAKKYSDVDMFYSSYVIVQDTEHQQRVRLSTPPIHRHDQLLIACYCGPFPLLKKQTIEEDGYFNPKYTISGDYEMWLRMSKKGRNLVRIDEAIGSYYHNPTGMSTNIHHFEEHVRQNNEFRAIHS